MIFEVSRALGEGAHTIRHRGFYVCSAESLQMQNVHLRAQDGNILIKGEIVSLYGVEFPTCGNPTHDVLRGMSFGRPRFASWAHEYLFLDEDIDAEFGRIETNGRGVFWGSYV